MLQETVDRNTVKKLVAVRTGSLAFTQVLELLLVNWGFSTGDPADRSTLLLIEEGCGGPAVGQKAVWLGFSYKSGQDRLGLPVRVTALSQLLERQFHQPPRLHMRKTVDLPARMLFHGDWHKVRLSSLSDMGTRFNFARELIKQEQVIIELAVGGILRQCSGQVIFSIAEDLSAVPTFQIGIVFHKQDNTLHADLRCDLIGQFLAAVRDGMALQDFQTGLAFFDLEPKLRRKLLEIDSGTTPTF